MWTILFDLFNGFVYLYIVLAAMLQASDLKGGVHNVHIVHNSRARRRVNQNIVGNVDYWFLVGPHCPQLHSRRARLALWQRLKVNGPHCPHCPRARRPGDNGRAPALHGHAPANNKRPAKSATRPLANPPANPYSIRARAFYRPPSHIARGYLGYTHPP